MPQNETVNRRIVIAARPHGHPTRQDFRLEEIAIPTPGEGQVLLRTLDLSIDPYMRILMDESGPGYGSSIGLGEPMPGETVSYVVASQHPDFKPGQRVLGTTTGWQDYALSDGQDLTQLGEMAHPTLLMGALGMPGFTAYISVLDLGQPKPGQTVVVPAATGPVGSLIGQIAKLKGARIVGIAGSADKCRYAVEELGFDVCLDRHSPQLAEQLATACPDGIDVYFEIVGATEVFSTILPLLNDYARMPLLGQISHFSGAAMSGPDRLPQLIKTVIEKRIRMQGLVIMDHYGKRFDDFRRGEMKEWVDAGKMKLREQVVDGLENAPTALIDLLAGRTRGKLFVRVAAA